MSVQFYEIDHPIALSRLKAVSKGGSALIAALRYVATLLLRAYGH